MPRNLWRWPRLKIYPNEPILFEIGSSLFSAANSLGEWSV